MFPDEVVQGAPPYDMVVGATLHQYGTTVVQNTSRNDETTRGTSPDDMTRCMSLDVMMHNTLRDNMTCGMSPEDVTQGVAHMT